MANVDKTAALALVKSRLNRMPGDTSLDDYLSARIDGAIEELENTGIRLRDDMNDLLLVVDYAVYMYQSRDKPGGMPDWLRLRRRERWMQEAVPR